MEVVIIGVIVIVCVVIILDILVVVIIVGSYIMFGVKIFVLWWILEKWVNID